MQYRFRPETPLKATWNRRGGWARPPEWVRYGAAGSLLAGGILLLTGQRRAALLASVAGAALAMVEEKELVMECWEALPDYLNSAQRMVDVAQQTIDDIAAKRDKILSIIGKSA